MTGGKGPKTTAATSKATGTSLASAEAFQAQAASGWRTASHRAKTGVHTFEDMGLAGDDVLDAIDESDSAAREVSREVAKDRRADKKSDKTRRDRNNPDRDPVALRKHRGRRGDDD
jgi:hypothetical protein